ncbi:MAG: hypothetical protein ACK6A8_12190, partial [Planctomycetota bacterium]
MEKDEGWDLPDPQRFCLLSLRLHVDRLNSISFLFQRGDRPLRPLTRASPVGRDINHPAVVW